MKQKIKTGRIRITRLFVIPLLITLSFSNIARSKVIWQVGKIDDDSWEFNSPDKKVIDYQVPLDWESRLGQEGQSWEGFPYSLYPYHDEANYPQEIRINFNYLKNYENPVLRIKASQREASQYLEVYKGPEAIGENLIGKKLVDLTSYVFYDFPLGNITKGLQEENRIILRNIHQTGNPLSENLFIVFDALYLDDNDSDEDSVSDPDEGNGDWDQDDLLDNLDPDTVCIPIRSDGTSNIKRICLDIRESEGDTPFFHEVKFLDTNSLNLSNLLKSERFFPYDILGFNILGIKPKEEVLLEINYGDDLHPDLQFYVYHDSNDWQELAFEYLDNKTVTIILRDGEAEDLDGKMDGSINTALALSYPSSLNIGIGKEGCFLESAVR